MRARFGCDGVPYRLQAKVPRRVRIRSRGNQRARAEAGQGCVDRTQTACAPRVGRPCKLLAGPRRVPSHTIDCVKAAVLLGCGGGDVHAAATPQRITPGQQIRTQHATCTRHARDGGRYSPAAAVERKDRAEHLKHALLRARDLGIVVHPEHLRRRVDRQRCYVVQVVVARRIVRRCKVRA